MVNQVILIGRLTEIDLVTSTSGTLYAKVNIAVGRGKSASIIPVILGGDAAEVIATQVEIGDRIRLKGRVHGHNTGKDGLKSVALILSESVRAIGKAGTT